MYLDSRIIFHENVTPIRNGLDYNKETVMKRQIVVLLGCLAMASCARYVPDPYADIPSARNVVLNSLFSDNMVLQHGKPIPVWGTADPGGKVVIVAGDEKVQSRVQEDGTWKAVLKPRPPGGPVTISVSGETTTILNDVLIGDVWVCSGQSNMEWPVGRVNDAEAEIAGAGFQRIRLFTVEQTPSEIPLADVPTTGWQICSPQTVADFSAVGYFFGRDIVLHHEIPIGLINTSWGGTPAEAWTSTGALKLHPDFQPTILKLEESLNKPQDERRPLTLAEWTAHVDGLDRGRSRWMRPGLDESDWQPITVPGLWESGPIGPYDGVVWFRKTVELPESWKGQDLALHLGPIDDLDSTYVNGVLIGSTAVYDAPRNYTVPSVLTGESPLQLTVRVMDWIGGGGFWGRTGSMVLKTAAGDSLPLAGEWVYKPGVPAKEVPVRADQNSPAALYNGMIHPLLSFPIRGAIWYQGESNAGQAYQYRTLFPLMITDWRNGWKQGDFPFYFVQLANYMEIRDLPGESDWAELREAQLLTQSLLPNTGMACIIDIGEADDIHPRNKQDVGKRLARIARHNVYGEDIPFSGPIFRRMEKEEGRIRLYFDHADGGLSAAGGGELRGFAVSGPDYRFVWADAWIEGGTVVVASPEIEDPVAVRYGWADNPVCNLINGAGLPASPFRTDDRRGVTQR